MVRCERRLRGQVGENRFDKLAFSIGASAISIDVEVAIRTDARAIWPVHIDAERLRRIHHKAAFNFTKARAR